MFRPSSGALECVYSLWSNAPTMLPAGDLNEMELSVPPHPQAVNAVLRMGEIIARNMLS